MALRPSFSLALAIGLTALFDGGAASAADAVRCTVVLDVASGKTIYRQGSCDEQVYPQSTFKLPLAMMGYDAGILVDAHRPLWPYREELDRPVRERKSTDPTIWERDSIVWYSQELTRKLGKQVFADYVRRFDYGNKDVAGGPGGTEGLTQAWLMSSLKISPNQQVAFLRRFLSGTLPISEYAVDRTKDVVPNFQAADGWMVNGKTGAGSMRTAKGRPDPNRPIGWFVGWAEREGRQVAFARLLIDTKPHEDTPISYTVRDTLIADLPALLQAGQNNQ